MTCQEFPVYENIFKLLFMGKETHYVKNIFCMFRIKSFILITSFLNILQKDTTMLMRLLFITHSLAHTIWSSSSESLSVIVNFVKTKSIRNKL